MSPLIPAALRAPQPAPAVQGAQRATTPSGDDFARALRQETADQSMLTSRPSTRPTNRDDRSDVARETRIDARRADQRRSAAEVGAAGSAAARRPADRTGGVDRADKGGGADRSEATSAAARPAEPSSDQNLSEGIDGASAQVTLSGPSLATVLLGGAGAPSAGAPEGLAAAGEVTSGDAEGIVHGLAQAAVGGSAPAAASSGAPGETLLAPAPGTAGLPAGAAAPAQPVVVARVPGQRLTDLDPRNATAQSALVSGQATAATAEGSAEGAPVVAVSVLPAPGQPGTATITGSTPVALPAVVPGTAISAQNGGAATDSGAGGAGRTPVADGGNPVAGPAPTALPGSFAHTLSGLTGVDRATAPAATGSAAQTPLADQVRGPVLALRSAAPGEHVLTLKVTPENLGPVQVRAHIGAEGIRIELVGATDAAREGLRNLLTDLRRDLAGTGMNASLSLGGDSGTGGRGGHGAAGDLSSAGDGSGHPRSGRSSDSAVTREPHTAPAVPLTPTSSGAHGVDILT